MHDSSRERQIALARDALLSGPGGAAALPALCWGERSWIARSWQRCLALGHEPERAVAFEPVERPARSRLAQEHAGLLAAARPQLQQVGAAVAPLGYFALLTNAHGVVIEVAGRVDHGDPHALALARVGVDLSERQVGTTAIGAALSEQAPVWLHRGEHFFRSNSVYSCAGAPIFAPHGDCIGMLDLTGVLVAERPELRHLAAQAARRISDRLVLATGHALQLRLAWAPGWEAADRTEPHGLVCLDADGQVTGSNEAARQMLPALRQAGARSLHASELFALPWTSLFDLDARREPTLVPLWSGLRVQLSAQRAGASRTPARGGALPTLRALEDELIHQAVREARGNVQEAARALGLSRATLYRRLALGRSGGGTKQRKLGG